MVWTTNAQERFIRDDERTNIKSCSFLLRDPVGIDLYESFDSFYEQVFIDLRDAKSVVCAVRSLCIHVWSEKEHSAVFALVSLQAFKHFLCIVEYDSCRIQAQRSVRNDSSIVPAFTFLVVHDEHVVCEFRTESQRIRIRLFFRVRIFSNWKFVFHNCLLFLFYFNFIFRYGLEFPRVYFTPTQRESPSIHEYYNTDIVLCQQQNKQKLINENKNN